MQKQDDSLGDDTSPSLSVQHSSEPTLQKDSQESLHMSSFLDFSQNDVDDKSLKTITPPSAKTQKGTDDTKDEGEARRKFMVEVGPCYSRPC